MYISNIAQVKPEALDYVNEDAMVIEYAERLGCLNKINPTDEVEQIRQARAMAQQQTEDLMNQQASADINKTKSQAKVAPDNMLGAEAAAVGANPRGAEAPNVG